MSLGLKLVPGNAIYSILKNSDSTEKSDYENKPVSEKTAKLIIKLSQFDSGVITQIN